MSLDRQPTLHGSRLTLRPLRADDFPELHRVAADPVIWQQHPAHERHREDVFRTYFDEMLASGGALVVRGETGAVIGASRYGVHDEQADVVEIGWTFLARSHWGGGTNRELKTLMLDHAFTAVGTVEFRVAPGNERSRHAVLKLGARELGERIDDGVRWTILHLARDEWRSDEESRGA